MFANLIPVPFSNALAYPAPLGDRTNGIWYVVKSAALVCGKVHAVTLPLKNASLNRRVPGAINDAGADI